MIKEIFRLSGILMVFAISFLFSSCGDDKEKEEPDDPTQTSQVVVNYILNLSRDYYDLWNIEVAYTDANGEEKVILIDNEWEMAYRYTSNMQVPEEFVFRVKGLPKTPAPTVDPSKVYNLTKTHQFQAVKISGDNSETIVGGDNAAGSSSMHVKGEKLEKQISEGISIVDATYKVKL